MAEGQFFMEFVWYALCSHDFDINIDKVQFIRTNSSVEQQIKNDQYYEVI